MGYIILPFFATQKFCKNRPFSCIMKTSRQQENSKMKIAICLRGQPRNYMAGYNSLSEKVISKFDHVDVFGHCWWDKEVIGQSYRKSCHVAIDYKAEENLDETLTKLYNFTKVRFDKPRVWTPTRKYRISDYFHPNQEAKDAYYDTLHSYFYSLKQAFNLLEAHEKETGIDYDWAIATRWDIGVSRFPDLSSPKFDTDYIYVSDFHKGRKYILNDNLWVLGRKYKYVLRSLYDDFEKDYDMTFDMPEKYRAVVRGTEIGRIESLNGEEHIAAHLLFKDALTDVVTTDLLDYNMVR